MGNGSYARWAGSWRWARPRSQALVTTAGRVLGDRLWPLLLLGVLLARASLFGSLYPFGLPFYLAAAGARPRARLPVAAALVAGAATRSPVLGLELGLLLLFAQLLLARLPARADTNPLGLGVIAFSLTATVRSAAAVVAGPTPVDLALALAESFLALLLTLVSSYALPARPRLRETAEELAQVRGSRGGMEQVFALAVLGAGAVAGTAGIPLGPLDAEGIMVLFLALVAGYAGGAGLGAAAGVVTGLVTAAPGSAWAVAVPAFAGLTAGVFRELGRVGTGIGGMLGSLLMTFHSYPHAPAGLVLAECTAALVLFALIPGGWLETARAAFRGAGEAELGVTRQRRLHDRVVQRLHSTSRLLTELDRSLASCTAPSRVETLWDFAGPVAFRLCDRCHGFRACWEEEFHQTYRGILGLLEVAERGGKPTLADLPEGLGRRCPHAEQLVAAVAGLGELYHTSRHWQERVQEYCSLMHQQVATLARVIGRMADQAAAPPSPATGVHPLAYEISSTTLPRHGERVPGDGVLIKELEDQRVLVVISDGMGVGEEAHRSSESACALMARMVDAGFDLTLAARLANLVLQRQGEQDRFVTLDAAVVDLRTGQGAILKMGAAPSYLKRGKEVSPLYSPSWPVGILPLVRTEVQELALAPGDLLVMATDGLWDREGQRDEDWVLAWLTRANAVMPAEVAERLIARATDHGRRPLEDDVAVAVLRVLPPA
ncbi:MAG: SpoIIE family protein phosphatase [Bacillota bacterium]